MDIEFIGNSPSIRNIKELLKVVSNTALNVIIYGETGVGKEVVARELHQLSDRREKRFIKVNCTALPFELLESELFGYEQGAFTGAVRFKPGKFEIASDGSIFLDEIGDIPLHMQAKLLHVLQSGEFSRLGGKEVKVNTWIIAATNHDLEHDLREGRFREDLYYRLNMIKIDIPPLRKRKEDIPLLVKYFAQKYRAEFKLDKDFSIDSNIMDSFLQYDWPGNIRELANMIQRIMVMGDSDGIMSQFDKKLDTTLLKTDLTDRGQKSGADIETIVPLKLLKASAAEYIEKRIIANALNMTGGNKVKAAAMLNISYKTLFSKMNDLGLRN